MIFNEAGKAVSKFNWDISEDWVECKNISMTINGKKYNNLDASCHYPDDNFNVKVFEKFINSADKLRNNDAMKELYNREQKNGRAEMTYDTFKDLLEVSGFIYRIFKNNIQFFIVGDYPMNKGLDEEHGWAIQYNYDGKKFNFATVGNQDIAL